MDRDKEKTLQLINPHVINENEFRRRRRSHDHFLTRVLESEKLFIKGSAHDLEAMVE